MQEEVHLFPRFAQQCSYIASHVWANLGNFKSSFGSIFGKKTSYTDDGRI